LDGHRARLLRNPKRHAVEPAADGAAICERAAAADEDEERGLKGIFSIGRVR